VSREIKRRAERAATRGGAAQAAGVPDARKRAALISGRDRSSCPNRGRLGRHEGGSPQQIVGAGRVRPSKGSCLRPLSPQWRATKIAQPIAKNDHWELVVLVRRRILWATALWVSLSLDLFISKALAQTDEIPPWQRCSPSLGTDQNVCTGEGRLTGLILSEAYTLMGISELLAMRREELGSPDPSISPDHRRSENNRRAAHNALQLASAASFFVRATRIIRPVRARAFAVELRPWPKKRFIWPSPIYLRQSSWV
jgi:hypothetical protein